MNAGAYQSNNSVASLNASKLTPQISKAQGKHASLLGNSSSHSKGENNSSA